MSVNDSTSDVTSDGPARGLAKVKRDLVATRVVSIVALAFVIVIAVWSIVGVVSLSAQVSSLSAKVDSLTARSGTSATNSGAGSAASGSRPTPAPNPGGTAPPAPAIGDVAAPAGANDSGAIVVGNAQAPTVVEVYADYQCPYCQRWETEIGTALMSRALDPDSDLAVLQYNMAFLGESNRQLDPPGASARAANAAACVLEYDGVEAFVGFNEALFATPTGSSPATRFDEASLLGLAGQSGSSEPTFACIQKESYMPFVVATTQASFARGVTGTPTVLIDGVPLQDPFGDARLQELLDG